MIAKTLMAAMVCGACIHYADPGNAATMRAFDAQLRVSALIDGRDRLVVTADTVQWQHFDYAAPGRHGGGNRPTYLWLTLTDPETGEESVQNISWIPEWSAPPPNEIRFRTNSSVLETPFEGVSALTGSWTFSANWVRCAGVVIVGQPSGGSGALVSEWNDNGCKSSAVYDGVFTGQVMVSVEEQPAPVPLPLSAAGLASGLLALAGCRAASRPHAAEDL